MGDDLPQSFGPYTLHDLIDRGGMAEIYRATMPGIGGFEKTVAIKKILPHLAENEEFITMLIDEARIIVSINHSNIAQVYDLGEIEDTYYIAMEYIHGIDLSDIIKKLKKRGEYIPLDHVAHIGSCMCAGLDAAHSKKDETGNPLNIVHRDVSPHNVIISYAGDVKIIDFGVAKASVKETHTKMGVIKGKLLYMAPEQAMAKDLDGRADLFAVGLCLYKMLTHELPFAGDNEFQIYNNILSKEIVPPKQLNPDVPEELNQIVMTLLQRDPDKRYQDGYAAKQDLDRCLHNIAPGYTVNRLSRFIEENFSKAAQDQPSEPEDTGDASRPQGIAPATPASNEVDTGQITAERRQKQAAPIEEGDPTVNMSRGDALAQLEPVRESAGPGGPPDSPGGPPALPQDSRQEGPARTETSDDETGQFQKPEEAAAQSSKEGVPPVVYAIGVMVVIIAGMTGYAVWSGTNNNDSDSQGGDGKVVVDKPDERTVAIKLTTDPEGATVIIDGDPKGATPAEFELEKSNKPVTIAFEKDRYETKRVRLVPNSSIDRVIALTRSLEDEMADGEQADAGDDTDSGDTGDAVDEAVALDDDESATDSSDDGPAESGRKPGSGDREEQATGAAPDRESGSSGSSGQNDTGASGSSSTESGGASGTTSNSGGGAAEKQATSNTDDGAADKTDEGSGAAAGDDDSGEDDFIPVLDNTDEGGGSADDDKDDSKDENDQGLIDPFG